jgi:hypothetical protein
MGFWIWAGGGGAKLFRSKHCQKHVKRQTRVFVWELTLSIYFHFSISICTSLVYNNVKPEKYGCNTDRHYESKTISAFKNQEEIQPKDCPGNRG